MFGFIYLAWSGISHIGYKIKELWFNSSAKIDERTNTYMAYDGSLRDANTNKRVTWIKDKNGDEVLWDKPGHVYRNISEEKRKVEYEQAKKKDDQATVYDTRQRRKITFKDENGYETSAYANIYKNLETSAEFATRKIRVNYRGKHNEDVEFYVLAKNPYYLVRMTDEQLKREKAIEKNGKYSWSKYPNDAEWFISGFNKEPKTFYGSSTPRVSFSR